MQEGHGALNWRAAAAAGASVALHLAIVSLGGVLFLGPLTVSAPEDADPLIVEVVDEDARPARADGVTRVARSQPAPGHARSQPARPDPEPLLPVLPVPGDDAFSVPPASRSSGSGDPTPPDVASGPADAAEVDLAMPIDQAAVPAPPTAAIEEAGGPEEVARLDEEVSQPGPAAAASSDETPAPGVAALREDSAAAPDADVPVRDPGEPVMTADRAMDERLDAVARSASVSARAAGVPFVGRREVFEFLLDHPEFATHVTRVLRVARYRIWRTEDGLFVDDGWGATGQMFVVRAARGTRTLYARGEFQHKLLPVITGEAVVTINYDAQPAGDGRDLLVADISSQLKIHGPVGDLVASLASGVATAKAEKESRRLVHIFARVLKAIDEKPADLYAGLRERPDVPRRELEQFRVLLKLP